MPHESSPRSSSIGILIELLGDILTVVGLTLQRFATLRKEQQQQEQQRSYYLTFVWFGGFIIYAVGQILELVALGFASESTVVATGNLALVFNAFASMWVFGEEFSWLPVRRGSKDWNWDGLNLLMLVVGSILTVWYSPLVSEVNEEGFNAHVLVRMWFETPFVYFSFLGSCVLVVLTTQMCRARQDEPPQPLRAALVLALLAAFSVTMSKVVTELFSRKQEGEAHQFSSVGSHAMLVLWILSLVAQLVILNVGLRDYEQSVFVPMSETLGTSITIFAGVLYFKTYKDFANPGSVIGFLVGVLLSMVGLFLTSQRHSPTKIEMQDRFERQLQSSGASSSSPRFGSFHLFRRSISLRGSALGEDPERNSSNINNNNNANDVDGHHNLDTSLLHSDGSSSSSSSTS